MEAIGGGAAGSVNMTLKLTNEGHETCVLRGYPGVSLAAGPAGAPIGAPAVRTGPGIMQDVVLAPGQVGAAALRYTNAGMYPACTHVRAAGYRIYPPEETTTIFLPQRTNACSNSTIKLLTIGPFQPY